MLRRKKSLAAWSWIKKVDECSTVFTIILIFQWWLEFFHKNYSICFNHTHYNFLWKALEKTWRMFLYKMVYKAMDYRLLMYNYFGKKIYNDNSIYEMVLNFKRNRFFPYFRMKIHKNTIINIKRALEIQ